VADLVRVGRRQGVAVDAAGDPIPLPYSVQLDVERFLRKNTKPD